jgi:hypothetical protein
MHDYQTQLLTWAAGQPQSAAMILFVVGTAYTLQGFRFARIMIAIVLGVVGYAFGRGWTAANGMEEILLPLIFAAVPGALALLAFRLGLLMASLTTFALAVQFIGMQLGLAPIGLLVCLGFGAIVGALAYFLHRRVLPRLLTTMQGSVMMLLGFVGSAGSLLPRLADTMISTAADMPFAVPMLLGMLCVMGYCYQANLEDGDIQTGSGRGWNEAQA